MATKIPKPKRPPKPKNAKALSKSVLHGRGGQPDPFGGKGRIRGGGWTR